MNNVQPTAADAIIRGRYVVSGIAEDGLPKLTEDGAVVVRGGRIMEVGRYSDLTRKYTCDVLYGGSGQLVHPGFVNAHHHIGLTPMQLGAPDAPLELWLANRLGERNRTLYLDTLYSAMEMIMSGVTTVQHLRGATPAASSVHTELSAAHEVVRAYCDIGMRVSYSSWTRDQNFLTHESNERFAGRLSDDARQHVAALHQSEVSAQDSIEVFRRMTKKYSGDGLVSIQLAPGNLHWCSDDILKELRDVSREHQVPLHMHLLETPYQQEYGYRRSGKSAIEHLESLGLLGSSLTLGHAVWASASDIKLLASSATRVCHNLSSNLRLRSGTAPLPRMLGEGLRVGIGIDEAGLNDDRDMLQELRLVLTLHQKPGHNSPMVPTSNQVFQMGTEEGAQTTRFGEIIGRLEAGRAADLVVVDWEKLTGPYLDPEIPVLDALLRRGKPEHVESVLIAGELVYHRGQFARVDRRAIHDDLKHYYSEAMTPNERRRRKLVPELRRAMGEAYAGYGYSAADSRKDL